MGCLWNSMYVHDITIAQLSGLKLASSPSLLPLAVYGHTHLLRSFCYYVGYCYYRPGATLPLYLSAVCFLRTERCLCTAHPSPPSPPLFNQIIGCNSATFRRQPYNLCVISKSPERPTFILSVIFFPFCFYYRAAQAVHTQRHVMTCCARNATAVCSPDDSHLCLHHWTRRRNRHCLASAHVQNPGLGRISCVL